MSIDLSQFHQVFFEECFESLDVMERILLNINLSDPLEEDINAVFRAAHSIKGGAGTFGFSQASEFAHVVESLLDTYRAGTEKIDTTGVDLVLKFVDLMRQYIGCLQEKKNFGIEPIEVLISRIETIINAEAEEPVSDKNARIEEEQFERSYWSVFFRPALDLVECGNEPGRLFRELARLGELNVEVHADLVPELESLPPEKLYLYWQLKLVSDCTEDKVREVFDWVADDSDLIIERIANDSEMLPVDSDDDLEGSASTQASSLQSTTDATESIPANKIESTSEPERSSPQSQTPLFSAETRSIRVNVDKIDDLMNMLGELVITQSMLFQVERDFDSQDTLARLQAGLQQLAHNTRDLQESVMQIRMVPISLVFDRFPRLVRDISSSLDKNVELVLKGQYTELDKTVMEKITDPLIHMVRNSLDHGIESEAERLEAGKPAKGTLTINAYHEGGNIVIEVSDDGKGIDPEMVRKKALEKGLIKPEFQYSDTQLQEMIFIPGLSTAGVISDLSGRGVGLDVVKKNIEALKGSVTLESEAGAGSKFKIKMPLTMAIIDGQLVRVGKDVYVVPVINLVESFEVSLTDFKVIGDQVEWIRLRDEFISVYSLQSLLNIRRDRIEQLEKVVVVVENSGKRIALLVDELLNQQQVVIKSLAVNYRHVKGVSGATILGDGAVAFILDVASLIKKMAANSEGLELAGPVLNASEVLDDGQL